MHKKSSSEELPNSFKKAIAISGIYLFDPDTLERYTIAHKDGCTLKVFESGKIELFIRINKSNHGVSSFGYHFCTANYIKQVSTQLFNSSGKKIPKTSIDTDLIYYLDGNKAFGIEPSNNYSKEIILTTTIGTKHIHFYNNEINHYFTPDSKLRKERKKEISDLKARYILENTICPKDTVTDSFNVLNKDNWKEVLESNEGMQYEYITYKPSTNPSWYIKKLLQLVDAYTDVYITNSTDYITW